MTANSWDTETSLHPHYFLIRFTSFEFLTLIDLVSAMSNPQKMHFIFIQ